MSNGCCTIVTPWFLSGSMPFFDERGEELVLVAAEPVRDLLALHLRDRRDPGALPRQLRHPRAREDLRDVDEVGALVPGGEQARQPVDAELRLAARDDLLGDDVRAAVLERDVQALPWRRSPA